MNKKAQGLSINVIIIVAIALIVLVVLIAIFTGRLGIFILGLKSTGDPTKTCSQQQGALKDACGTNEVSIQSADAQAAGKLCCKTST